METKMESLGKVLERIIDEYNDSQIKEEAERCLASGEVSYNLIKLLEDDRDKDALLVGHFESLADEFQSLYSNIRALNMEVMKLHLEVSNLCKELVASKQCGA